MINNFNYYAPTEVIFGKNTQKDTGRYIKKYHGTKILVLYGSDRVRQNGLMDGILLSMEKEGLVYRLLGV